MSCHNAIAAQETNSPEWAKAAEEATSTARVGDRQRYDVQQTLGRALAEGYLDLDEFQVRLDQVAGATTSAVLSRLVADLPVEQLSRNDPTRVAASVAAARGEVIGHARAYLAGAVLMVVLWLAIAVPTGQWYPWPVWPVLGGAIGIICRAVRGRAATRS